jgi:hypothetical protein
MAFASPLSLEVRALIKARTPVHMAIQEVGMEEDYFRREEGGPS